MKTWGIRLLIWTVLALAGSGSAVCLPLNAEASETDIAGHLIGHGCFVGYNDAYVDWTLTQDDLGNRNTIVHFEAIDGSSLSLLNQAGDELASIEANATANWILQQGATRFRVDNPSGERFVVTTEQGVERITFESSARGADSRQRVRGPIGAYAGLIDTAPYYLTWEIREDSQPLWDLQLTPSPGLPLNVKIFDPEGNLLEHIQGEPGVPAQRMPLELEPGDYTFVIAQAEWPGATVQVRAQPVGAEAENGQKVNPSHDQATANRITTAGVSGTLDDDNTDAFRLDLTEEQAGLYNFSLGNDNEMDLCLLDTYYAERACWYGTDISVSNLQLTGGSHYFRLRGNRNNADSYSLQFEPAGEHDPRDAIAPAGLRQDAYVMQDGTARLTVGARTDTWLAFDVTDPGLYRVQLQGDNPVNLYVYDGGGAELRRVSPEPNQPIRIDNVPLREGLNYVMLDARPGQYAIRALRVGDLPVENEVLPAAEATEEVAARPEGAVVASLNVSSGSASLLQPGVPYSATLLPLSQTAYYRFTLHNEQMVRITLTPPEDSGMRLYGPGGNVDSTEFEGPTVMEDWLPAGTYEVSARSLDDADGWYTLQLDLLDPFVRNTPHNHHTQEDAVPLPADFHLSLAGVTQSESYWRLPELERPTTLTIHLDKGQPNGVRIYDQSEATIDRTASDETSVTYELPAGIHDLRLMAGYEWDVQLEFEGGPEASRSNLGEDVELELELSADEVAAWSIWGQQLNGTLHVRNEGETDYSTSLLSHSSDPRVRFETENDQLEVPAGESLKVPVQLILPADVYASNGLDFNLALQDDAGGLSSTRSSVLPVCGAPLLGGHSWWPLPDSVLGQLNVAWQPFGATLQSDSSSDLAVFDGRISPAGPPTRAVPYEYVLDLGEPRELTATVLHPSGDGSPQERLHNFEIATSDDGDTWTAVLTAELSSAPMEQVFEFDEPVTTRWVKLTTVSPFDPAWSQAGIGEWKLLSAPDGVQRNIAAAGLGGHVVRSAPLLYSGSRMLQDEDYGGSPDDENVRVRAGEPLPEWVIGFQHNRAASISSIEWHDSDNEQNIDRLSVSVSTESPLGPWEPLADWQLERQDGKSVLELSEPVWARFIRFEVVGESPESSIYYELPLLLKVMESGAVPSILGEWGIDSNRSYYEYSNPELFTEATVVFGSNDSWETAQLLEDHEAGYVQTGVAEGWYRVVMPEERNLAHVTVTSEPGVVLGYELFSPEGEPVGQGLSDDGTIRLNGEPGDEWYLRVFEPPRSVLFVWDTSGSVRPYQFQTYAALEAFAGAIRGERESVMLQAFGAPPAFLMPEWSSSAAEVSRTINQYDRSDDSSNAELNLLAASDAIASREGVRAIVLITDAESGGHDSSVELWDSLAKSGAQVYSLEISSAGNAPTQDLMQDWAAANGGHYVNATDLLQLEQGFARADCLIRRAKYVEVSVEFQERAATPGSLTVRGPAVEEGETASVAADGGILVILDASGSMYRTLDGRYRYEIAKEVLSDLVSNVLPADVPFALRVFGNREANTCRSDLEVPLAPLDPGAVSSVIAGIVPQSFAGTPIAASLQAAAGDLAGAEGARSVVLITDGEESCDGDVEAAINELRDAGYDVTLNVIGFDFDAEDQDAARERFREWAALGGGQYFDAVSADELEGALRSSVGRPYEVYDAEGALVARGVVDGPAVELEGGEYRVVVTGEVPVEFEGVRVDGEAVGLVLE